MLNSMARLTDSLEHFWEEHMMKRRVGGILVIAYLASIVLIELNRQGILPDPLAGEIPTNHFYAVEVAFTLLLMTEVVSLVFSLTRSFSRSIGIQLELLSLIFLRDTFKQFTAFSEPIEWDQVSDEIAPMIVDSLGALTIFVIIGVYYGVQKRRPITTDETEQAQFITYKKIIALALLFVFIGILIFDGVRLLQGLSIIPFFETFYTVLIFTDVLMVLISLRYGNNFAVTFRNFGYAAVTVFIRLSLIAPPLIGVLMGIGTSLFALGLTYAYNRTGDFLVAISMLDGAPQKPSSLVEEAKKQSGEA